MRGRVRKGRKWSPHTFSLALLLMAFTNQKIASVSRGFWGAASAFFVGAIYIGWKHGWHWESGGWRIALPGLAAGAFAAFPVFWTLTPDKHPVRRALGKHGDPASIASILDAEMRNRHEIYKPFHFTKRYLVYETPWELNVIPYVVIASVKTEVEDGTRSIVLTTNDGKTYEWSRTLFQGMFDPDRVVTMIERAARLETAS